MKIVVLDGYTTTQKELNFKGLDNFGEVFFYDYTPVEEVVQNIGDAEVVFTNKTILDKKVLDCCDKVKYIGVLATGFNVVDIDYCNQRGITVTNIPTYGTDSVAQLVFAHILEYCHHIGTMDASVKKGDWCRCRDFSYTLFPLIELAGKRIGIYGFGRIGKRIADIALAFKMEVVATDNYVIHYNGVRQVDEKELFSTSDFISLNAPLTPQTKGIINFETLALMKSSAYIVNTARGGLIDEDALIFAIESGSLAGAGLDVMAIEPPDFKDPLLFAKGVTITPHIAWATKEARQRLIDISIQNLRSYLNGQTINNVTNK